MLAEVMPGSAMVTAPNLTLGLAWLLLLPNWLVVVWAATASVRPKGGSSTPELDEAEPRRFTDCDDAAMRGNVADAPSAKLPKSSSSVRWLMALDDEPRRPVNRLLGDDEPFSGGGKSSGKDDDDDCIAKPPNGVRKRMDPVIIWYKSGSAKL